MLKAFQDICGRLLFHVGFELQGFLFLCYLFTNTLIAVFRSQSLAILVREPLKSVPFLVLIFFVLAHCHSAAWHVIRWRPFYLLVKNWNSGRTVTSSEAGFCLVGLQLSRISLTSLTSPARLLLFLHGPLRFTALLAPFFSHRTLLFHFLNHFRTVAWSVYSPGVFHPVVW